VTDDYAAMTDAAKLCPARTAGTLVWSEALGVTRRWIVRSAQLLKRPGFAPSVSGGTRSSASILTIIQEEGATAFEAAAQAGHSSVSTTGLYTDDICPY